LKPNRNEAVSVQIYTSDETFPTLLLGYVDYKNANTMSPLSSSDLPTTPGDVEETLAS
jgi:hypothetical protein